MPISLAQRDRQPEIMDQPDLDHALHVEALGALDRVHFISRTSSVLWREVERLTASGVPVPVRILDVACGGGAVVRRLAQLASVHRVQADVHGCDVSPTAIAYAREAARSNDGNHFFIHNALAEPLPTDYDILTCTLFLHHLDEPDAIVLLQRMAEAARRAIIIDDLVRSRFGYFLAWWATRTVARSSVAQIDGPLSVRSAFCVAEVRDLAHRAGLEGYKLQLHFPARFLFSWAKT